MCMLLGNTISVQLMMRYQYMWSQYLLLLEHNKIPHTFSYCWTWLCSPFSTSLVKPFSGEQTNGWINNKSPHISPFFFYIPCLFPLTPNPCGKRYTSSEVDISSYSQVADTFQSLVYHIGWHFSEFGISYSLCIIFQTIVVNWPSRSCSNMHLECLQTTNKVENVYNLLTSDILCLPPWLPLCLPNFPTLSCWVHLAGSKFLHWVS